MRQFIPTQRLQDLSSVLEYCSRQEQLGRAVVFTVYERILINQERGSIFTQLNVETLEVDKRYYQVTAKIEAKINFILTKTKKDE